MPNLTLCHNFKWLSHSFEMLESKVVLNFTYHSFLIFLLARFAGSAAIQLNDAIVALSKESEKLYRHLPTDLSELDAICQSLNSHGRILYLHCTESIAQSWIVLNRQSLLTRINGTIFAPEGFSEHRSSLASSTGVVKQSILTAHFPDLHSDLVTELITFFEFGRQISNPETLRHLLPPREAASGEPHFFFPALVCIDVPEGVWKPSERFSYYSGWLMQCTQPEHFFTPRMVQTLILRVSFSLALPRSDPIVREQPAIHRQCKVWKNGVYWSQPSGAEGLLEITSKQVTALVRSLNGHEMAAVELRSTLVRMILDAQQEFCDGVIPSESMLHPHHATQYPLSPADDLELFSSTVIAQVIVGAAPFVVSTKDTQLEVEKLLHFEPYAHLGEGYIFDLGSSGKKSSEILLADIVDRFRHLTGLGPTSEFMLTLELLARQRTTSRDDLRRHFDKYSLFACRNILIEAGFGSSLDIDFTQEAACSPETGSSSPYPDDSSEARCTEESTSDSVTAPGGNTTGSDVPLTVNIVASGGNAAGGGATGGSAIQGADGSSGGQTTGGSAVGGNAAVTVNVTINVAGGVQDKSSAHASLVD